MVQVILPTQDTSIQYHSHPRFIYWTLDIKQCHQLLPQTRIYLQQNPEDVNYSGEELRAIVGNSSVDQLMKWVQQTFKSQASIGSSIIKTSSSVRAEGIPNNSSDHQLFGQLLARIWEGYTSRRSAGENWVFRKAGKIQHFLSAVHTHSSAEGNQTISFSVETAWHTLCIRSPGSDLQCRASSISIKRLAGSDVQGG